MALLGLVLAFQFTSCNNGDNLGINFWHFLFLG